MPGRSSRRAIDHDELRAEISTVLQVGRPDEVEAAAASPLDERLRGPSRPIASRAETKKRPGDAGRLNERSSVTGESGRRICRRQDPLVLIWV
jgi:hypothetical protein